MKKISAVVLLSVFGCTLVATEVLQSYSDFHLNLVKRSADVPSPRIINGAEAEDGQFPYVVFLTLYVNKTVYGWCSGVLVTPEFVLTVAHCVDINDNYNPYIGIYIEAGSVVRGTPRQSTSLTYSNVFVHQNYSAETLENDIALLKTSEFDCTTPYVQYVKTAPSDWDISKYISNSYTIAGFGTIDNIRTYSDVLRYADLSVIDTSKCQEDYDGLLTFPNNTLCAQDFVEPISAACFFDSGDPLISHYYKHDVIIALNIFVYPGHCDQYAQGFIHLAPYYDWIQNTISDNA
ncbi:hypothetical protein DMENIID0001_050440 [Sergentomyia squamirostris]